MEKACPSGHFLCSFVYRACFARRDGGFIQDFENYRHDRKFDDGAPRKTAAGDSGLA